MFYNINIHNLLVESNKALKSCQKVCRKAPQSGYAENNELPQFPFGTLTVNDQSCLDTYDWTTYSISGAVVPMQC